MIHSLKTGTLMRHTATGRKGTVELDENRRPFISYSDRGEDHFSSRISEWEPAYPERFRKLRDEEIAAVAFHADAKLRALIEHTPERWWEGPGPVFDEGLVQVITEYLKR